MGESIKKGDWVQVHNVVLTKEQRAPQVPDDTKNVPLEMWVKGCADVDGEVGAEGSVTTVTGRQVSGTIVGKNLPYTHGFGDYVEELGAIDVQVKNIIFADWSHEKSARAARPCGREGGNNNE